MVSIRLSHRNRVSRTSILSRILVKYHLLLIVAYLLLLPESEAFGQPPYASSSEDVLPNITVSTTSSTSTTISVLEYWKIESKYVWKNAQYNSWDTPWNLADLSVQYQPDDARAPSCIYETLLQIFNECVKTYNQKFRNSGVGYDYMSDDCVAWRIFNADNKSAAAMNSGTYDSYYSQLGSQVDWAQNAILKRQSITAFGRTTQPVTLSTIYLHLNSDSSCSAVDNVPLYTEVYSGGVYYWYASPVSLLWDDTTEIDREIALAPFPLDPEKGASQWAIWKASAKAPLLVYDPEHRGKITSAYQLFGNWTFGGKKFSKAQSFNFAFPRNDIDEHNIQEAPWKNGYEPMKLLDVNGDDKLSGAELEPLALWFDQNRNGVSEDGEVKLLGEIGIISLYFQPNREDTETRSLYADKGYERIKDGKIITGRSVDWWSDTSSNQGELIYKHLTPALSIMLEQNTMAGQYGKSTFSRDVITAKMNNSSSRVGISESKTADVKPEKSLVIAKNNISGMWKWVSTASRKTIRAEGFLGFSDNFKNNFRGHAYTVFSKKQSKLGFSHIFSAALLSGKKTKRKDGKFNLHYIVTPSDSNRLETKAVFDPQKQTIVGTTIAKVAIGTKAIDLSYSWKAKRLEANEMPQDKSKG